MSEQSTIHQESIVTEILNNDGVEIIDVDNVQTPVHTSLTQLQQQYPKDKSWAKRIINTFNSAYFNSATIISQKKEEGCRRHKHPDCDEFWVILSGEAQIEAGDDRKIIRAVPGDIIYLKKGTFHKFCVVSDEPAVRLSVSVEQMQNIYEP